MKRPSKFTRSVIWGPSDMLMYDNMWHRGTAPGPHIGVGYGHGGCAGEAAVPDIACNAHPNNKSFNANKKSHANDEEDGGWKIRKYAPILKMEELTHLQEDDETTDFVVVNVINSSTNRFPVVFASSHIVTSLLIDRKMYELDLMRGLRWQKQVQRQLELDVPRCEFYYNGQRTQKSPSVSTQLARFCTQSVMALPVEIVQRSFPNYIVSEMDCNIAMIVKLSGDHSVFLNKRLSLVSVDSSHSIPFDISIAVHNLDHVVYVDIKFDDAIRTDDVLHAKLCD
jgi:hypothetical protein